MMEARHNDGRAAHASRRGDTRARIQQVALELFAEHGYERTSLREIAERLGVTKAALYYHFKSKEDIVRSFTEDYFARLDALIAWGSEPAAERRDRQGTARPLHHHRAWRAARCSGSSSATRRPSTAPEDGKHRFTQFRPRLKALIEIITGPRRAATRSRIRAAAGDLRRQHVLHGSS